MGPGAGTAIEEMAANIVDTRYEAIDAETIGQAKLRIIDTVGCLIGGALDPGNPELVDLFRQQGGTPEATILMYGHKVPVAHAAMANCILCRSFDFEPVSPVVDGHMSPGHISGTTVMTALSMAEACKVDGRELLTALMVGDDLTARVLVTSGFDINLGWDGNGTANAFGAAAIAGRLLGLDAVQMRHALGLVLSQMGGTMQNIWDATPAFKLPQGLSARNGIFSAQLAAAGWTGPEDALLSPNGYYRLYTRGFSKGELLTKDLGKRYYADRAIKPYPSCRATHMLIELALKMVAAYSLKAADIEQVFLFMPARDLNNFCAKPLTIGSFPHAAAAFSYHYTIAIALLHGSVKPEHFSNAAIQDPATAQFIQRITLSRWPQADFMGSGIRVILKDGREFEETAAGVKGDFVDNPLSAEEFKAKFMANVDYSRKLTTQQAEKVLSFLNDLEKRADLSELIALLPPAEGK